MEREENFVLNYVRKQEKETHKNSSQRTIRNSHYMLKNYKIHTFCKLNIKSCQMMGVSLWNDSENHIIIIGNANKVKLNGGK